MIKEVCFEVEVKVVGSVCWYFGWVIEDCYVIYGWFFKVGVYVGWCEMDEYMWENKIEMIVL